MHPEQQAGNLGPDAAVFFSKNNFSCSFISILLNTQIIRVCMKQMNKKQLQNFLL